MLLSFVPLAVGGCKQFTSCKRSREHVRQARELSDGFNWNIPFKCRRLKPWFDFFQRISEGWKSRQILIFLGGGCSGNSRGKTWGLISLAIRALLHDLVTGGIPHAGSRHGGPLWLWFSLCLWVTDPGLGVLTRLHLCPSCLSSCCFFFMLLVM